MDLLCQCYVRLRAERLGGLLGKHYQILVPIAETDTSQIGKTSGLVLTLCGVLKDILLVIASVLIWGTMISGLQIFGYSIALGGMLYYKLGADAIKDYFKDGGRRWAEFGATRPLLRKLLVIALAITTLFVLLGGLAPTYAPEYDPANYITGVKNAVGGRM
jgi:arginine exporter protein ArgO